MHRPCRNDQAFAGTTRRRCLSSRRFSAIGNQLTGPIPPLTGLTNFAILRIYDNQLSGTIPSLAGLVSLWSFDVSNNQLRGDVPEVPSPNALTLGQSDLCPNGLDPTPSPAWDAATGQTPWYQNCYGLFDDGFEE